MQPPSTTFVHQSALAAYCRTGVLKDIPGVITENAAQYRRLVYNVIDDMLQNAFPLTFDLLQEEEWYDTVNGFFMNHACVTPQVWYMPKEFKEYLISVNHPTLDTYPHLKDLLQFEWIEVELFMMEDLPVPDKIPGTILSNNLLLNPEHRLLHYHYPVHIRKAHLITAGDFSDYYAVAHRHPENGSVFFTNLSPALLRMLEYLQKYPMTLQELYDSFQSEYNVPLSMHDRSSALSFVEEAFNSKLIIGFQA